MRRGGVGTHFVIHKYFYERSCSWKAIREEEQEAENHGMKTEDHDVKDADMTDLNQTKQLNFTPIDARHLSSYPLISQRVIKLLLASKNHMHASKDMLMILVYLFLSVQPLIFHTRDNFLGIFKSHQNRPAIFQDENQRNGSKGRDRKGHCPKQAEEISKFFC